MCAALDLRTNNIRSILDPDEVRTANDCGVVIRVGGKSPLLVSESGLYSLILRSRKPDAKVFQKWITSVVLPAIRKDGA